MYKGQVLLDGRKGQESRNEPVKQQRKEEQSTNRGKGKSKPTEETATVEQQRKQQESSNRRKLKQVTTMSYSTELYYKVFL